MAGRGTLVDPIPVVQVGPVRIIREGLAYGGALAGLGLLIAESKVSQAAAGERTAAIRAVVAQMVPIAGTLALGLFVLVLGSTLLPTFKVLLVLLVVVALVTWLLWRSFVKVYAKAQVALQETFATPAMPHSEPAAAAALPVLLREADLATVILAADSPAVGKLIRELELRTRTGASIVGFARNGTNLINPGPDEELQSGDHVLLLGNSAQLKSAIGLVSRKDAPR